MRVALGTDELTPIFDELCAYLESQGHQVTRVTEGTPWPQVGAAVGRAVIEGLADMGIVACTTGTGVSMAANRLRGVRAALCTDAETARGARRWNDANVLAFGLRLTSNSVAKEMVEAFLETPFDRSEAGAVDSLESLG